MANLIRAVVALITLLLFINSNPLASSANGANLLPFEDETLGRNSSAYLSTYEVPSKKGMKTLLMKFLHMQ